MRTVPQSYVIVFENPRFRPPTRKRVTGVFENIHSGERFQNPPFSITENAVYEQNGQKYHRFQKYPDTC